MDAPLARSTYLQVLQAALSARQYRYARQAAMDWLATYPGDLAVSLAYARALQGETRLDQAAAILHGLCRSDPEFVEAVETLLAVERQAGGDGAGPLALRFALIGRLSYHRAGREDAPEWSAAVWKARLALAQKRERKESRGLAEAEYQLQQVMRPGEAHSAAAVANQPLLAVTHLQLLDGRSPLAQRLEIVQGYTRRWPDCLAVTLWLAEWRMEAGQHAEAVALLHQVASRDVGGQVAARLWGAQHPYRALWPERLERRLPGSPPAAVAAVLGWNRLDAGGPTLPADSARLDGDPPQLQNPAVGQNTRPLLPEAPAVPDDLSLPPWELSPLQNAAAHAPLPGALMWRSEVDAAGSRAAGSRAAGSRAAGSRAAQPATTRPSSRLRRIWNPAMPQTCAASENLADELPGKLPGEPPVADPSDGDASAPDTSAPDMPAPGNSPHHPAGPPAQAAGARPAAPRLPAADDLRPAFSPAAPAADRNQGGDPELRAVAKALDKTARRQRLPGVSHLDGRFPVYVVFSLHQRLAATYGPQAAALVESEMAELVETVAKLPRWGARLVLADDPACLQPLGLSPLRSADPWVVKLFLSDLDSALARLGERLGALLIVGGPEIVPFHHLPNPVDDQDVDVPSDNPYATRDENYFVPEWPVGRLPGGAGRDAHLLLSQLQNIRHSHTRPHRSPSWLGRAWSWLRRRLGRANRRPGRHQPPFGYTAAVWRQAAVQVFSPIGRARSLHTSPPFGLDGSPGAALDGLTQPEPAGLTGGVPEPYGRLGYFNLHGLIDAPDWYGQRDPLDDSDAPDYPVALRPQDIDLPDAGQPAAVPRVVFSEACYGLNIQDRTPDQAISLRFLQAGALAVAGCTVMAYGAIASPLVAADFLGQTFWQLLQDGLPAGEALRQAKIRLATEMSNRQGYLDGEDQKTLISFVLYGDPLAQVTASPLQAKSIRCQERTLADLRTVCERSVPAEADPTLPPEVLAGVRRTVARYLPGMSDARVTYAPSRDRCAGEGHACPTSQMEQRPQPGGLPRPHIPARRPASGRGRAAPLPGLVTLSKQVSRSDGVHPRIARLTLDERGKLMKLVVSR